MKEKFEKARTITLMMMGGVILLGLIAWMISGDGYGASSEGKMNFMRLLMYVFSATQIVLAFSIRRIMVVMLQRSNPARLITMQIFMNVFCEAISLFGFILVLMSEMFTDYAIFAFISLCAFALFFPKKSEWEVQPFDSRAGV